MARALRIEHMEPTREDLDAALVSILGQTWAEIAAEHDMKCGRCKGGTLRLQEVAIQLHFPGLWEVDRDPVNPRAWYWPPEPTRTVTVVLHCEDCEMEFEMPLHAKERG